jgi:hypothetical protein
MLLLDRNVVGRMTDKELLAEMIELREIQNLLEVVHQETFNKRHLNVIRFKEVTLLSLPELNVVLETMEQFHNVLTDLKDQLNLRD